MADYSNNPPPQAVLPEKDWVEIPTVQARRVVLRFLKKLFEASPNPALRWIPDDPASSTIQIVDSFPESPEQFGRRPIIAVDTTGAQLMGLTIDTLEYEDFNTLRKTYTDMMSTTLVVSCVSQSALEVEHLSWLVGKYFWLLKDWLRANGFFDVGRGIQMSPVTPIGQVMQDSTAVYRVATVTMPVYFHQRHHVQPPLKTWNKFDVEISAVSTTPRGTEPPQVDLSGGAVTYESPDGEQRRRATENWDDAPPTPPEDEELLIHLTITGEEDG